VLTVAVRLADAAKPFVAGESPAFTLKEINHDKNNPIILWPDVYRSVGSRSVTDCHSGRFNPAFTRRANATADTYGENAQEREWRSRFMDPGEYWKRKRGRGTQEVA
jgi:hypothetical protein